VGEVVEAARRYHHPERDLLFAGWEPRLFRGYRGAYRLAHPLDGEGWPDGVWEVWLDHRDSGINPDGAVVDADGRFWCAEWGGARVACYDPDGKLVEEISLDVPQPTCPAFGGG
jgi:sugar lactone lactonase YvrE